MTLLRATRIYVEMVVVDRSASRGSVRIEARSCLRCGQEDVVGAEHKIPAVNLEGGIRVDARMRSR